MGPWPSTDGAVRPSVSAVTTSTERPVLRRNPNDRVALTKCGRLRVSEDVRPESPGELDDDDDAFALLLEAHLSACVAVEAGPAGDGLGGIAVVDIGLRCVLGGDLAALECEGHEVLCRFRVACCGHYPESVGAAHRCAGQVLHHAVEGEVVADAVALRLRVDVSAVGGCLHESDGLYGARLGSGPGTGHRRGRRLEEHRASCDNGCG